VDGGMGDRGVFGSSKSVEVDDSKGALFCRRVQECVMGWGC
jgi:hypothetical protein